MIDWQMKVFYCFIKFISQQLSLKRNSQRHSSKPNPNPAGKPNPESPTWCCSPDCPTHCRLLHKGCQPSCPVLGPWQWQSCKSGCENMGAKEQNVFPANPTKQNPSQPSIFINFPSSFIPLRNPFTTSHNHLPGSMAAANSALSPAACGMEAASRVSFFRLPCGPVRQEAKWVIFVRFFLEKCFKYVGRAITGKGR